MNRLKNENDRAEDSRGVRSASPQVSVVIPAYDRTQLCREAVASARYALHGIHGEIIVMDDASPRPLRDELPRDVRVERISRSGMPGHVRNEGVKRAQGRLVAFLDSDDLWHERKLFKQLERLGSNGTDNEAEGGARESARMVHCRERWLRGDRELSQKGQRHSRRGDIFEDAVIKCIVGPSTFVVEKELFTSFGGYRPDLEIAEDYELMVRMLAFERIEYVDEPLVDKRDHSGPQLSHAYGHIEGFRIRALGDALADMLEARETLEWLREAVSAIDEVTSVHAGGKIGKSSRTRWGEHDPASLPPARVLAAAREYARKCEIFAEGAAKRGRGRDAQLHEQASDFVRRLCEYLAEEAAAR